MRASLTRVWAHAGLWCVVAGLAAATVFAAAAVLPTTSYLQEHGLRQMMAQASYQDRDIVFNRRIHAALVGEPQAAAEHLQDAALRSLPAELRDAVDTSWAYQYTSVVRSGVMGPVLFGDGVTREPHDRPPVISFHHQPGLAEEVTMAAGTLPATDADRNVIEVMAAVGVAETLGLMVGQEYELHPQVDIAAPEVELDPALPTVRLSGTFQPADPAAPVWEHPPLQEATLVTLPSGDPPFPTAYQAPLVTDQAAFDLMAALRLTTTIEPYTEVRVRLDPARLDPAAVDDLSGALTWLHSSPGLISVDVETRLAELLADYARLAAALRAVVAVVAAGIIATLVGLLVLAARLVTERRRTELTMLRARGASAARVAGRMAGEGAWVLVPAAAAGWLLHRLLSGDPAPGPAGETLPALAAALLVLVALPAAAVWPQRQAGQQVRQRRSTPVRLTGRSTPVRLTGRSTPVRLTVEATVLALAGLGTVLVQQRGLSSAGVDPYLSAVPVLLAAAGGVVALRLYPLPMRVLAALARRLRGVVAFVGMARAGRAAPGAALGLLVLVLAVAIGGFAGAVSAGLDRARDSAAIQEVGAHIRVAGETIPDQMTAAVGQVPGVTAVAVVSYQGTLRDGQGGGIPGSPTVVAVDTEAYQQVLAAVGAEVRLPQRLISAGPGATPVPLLAGEAIAGQGELQVRIDGVDYPATVAGALPELPGPEPAGRWVLAPRQALPDPGPVEELLVAGAGADPDAVRDTAARFVPPDELTVTSVAAHRDRLAGSGFDDALRLVFTAGTAGGAAAALLAVTLALVVLAPARGRALSLLRTMGLSGAQACGVLLVELLPWSLFAVAVGAGAGVVLPLLLGSALGLSAFTGGIPLPVTADPIIVGILVTAVVSLVVAGVLVEAAVNRRLGLGGVLRVE